MLIQCTKKLLDQLNMKPITLLEEDPLFSWHANLITVNRRKTLVFVNDKNRYAIVLHGLKAKDFTRLDELLLQAIRDTFQIECVKDEIIEQYIHRAKEITYTKTKNRTLVARMNKACETAYYYEDLLVDDSIIQTAMGMGISRNLVGDGTNRYIYPNEEMYKDLEGFAGGPIFNAEAVEIKVTLNLENHHVWRRVIVPMNITFNQLHRVVQIAFGWKDYHLHEFYVYDNETLDNKLSINHSGYHKEGLKPIVNLICNEEALSYEIGVPMKLEKGIKLSEYIPAKIKYNYDFGDDWQHEIEVERVISDYDKNYPVCLQGEGNTPPEDVGGEHGYEEFLKIIADDKHPDYQNTVNWGKGQGYQNFDMEMVNRLLKFM